MGHITPLQTVPYCFVAYKPATGMDIKQGLSAVAAVTLGKDMTFRDYAQGAFRMRGIGRGQKVQVLVIPEVQRLVGSQIAAGEGTTRSLREQSLQVGGILLELPRFWWIGGGDESAERMGVK